MNHNRPQIVFPLHRAAAVMAALLGGGALVAFALGGGWPASGSAIACLAAYLAALIPVRFALLPGLAFLWTMVLRITLTVAGMMLVARATTVDIDELALWTACWYLLLLIVEVMMLTRHLSSNPALKEKAL